MRHGSPSSPKTTRRGFLATAGAAVGAPPPAADRGREHGYVRAVRAGRREAPRFSFRDGPHGPPDDLARGQLYDPENDGGGTDDTAHLAPAGAARPVGYMDEAHEARAYA